MQLISLHIKNYRNFINSGEIPYHDLTIFVGENGSGKTSTIDALALLIDYGKSKPIKDDFVNSLLPIEIEGVFSVSQSDTERSIDKYVIENRFTLKYQYQFDTGAAEYSAVCIKYQDDRFNTYKTLSAELLKDFVRVIGITPLSTKANNYDAIENYITESQLKTINDYSSIKWSEVSTFIPVLQRYSSGDYSKPENIIRKTLHTIYRSHFYENDENGEERLKSDYSSLKNEIANDLNLNIDNQLKEQLSKHLDNVSTVGGDYNIDFANGLTLSSVVITFEDGTKRSIDQLGEGHRKKATLAILEWDAEVSKATDEGSVIKAYDEPDANLDFTAQRKIFATINNDVQNNDNVSAIICTHSLVLIDRAPAESINRILLDNQRASIDFLKTNGDENIKAFLSEVAEISGLRNSSIFYEKAFLVVEGESEEASIGLLYKIYVGRSLPEDGIVLINLKTNGQWNNVLKFLSANKDNCTVILLDADTQYVGSTRAVTQQKLVDSGFSGNFLTENCFFIGDKEFEDTYTDNDIAAMANLKFPKEDNTAWTASDFVTLRTSSKFSADLSQLISREHRNHVSKPVIAYEMALMYDFEMVSNNTVLKNLFDKLSEIVHL